MFSDKQKSNKNLKIVLEILILNYKLNLSDERLIALIVLKRKVRALQGYSAR